MGPYEYPISTLHKNFVQQLGFPLSKEEKQKLEYQIYFFFLDSIQIFSCFIVPSAGFFLFYGGTHCLVCYCNDDESNENQS